MNVIFLDAWNHWQIKKEKPLDVGCKGEPMDTSSSSLSGPAEEKKPDIKKEPKEEDDGTRSTPSGQNKKKGKSEIFNLWLLLNRTIVCWTVYFSSYLLMIHL